MLRFVQLQEHTSSIAQDLIIAICEAQSLTARKLEAIRAFWSPYKDHGRKWVSPMPYCYLVLPGTSTQLEKLAPLQASKDHVVQVLDPLCVLSVQPRGRMHPNLLIEKLWDRLPRQGRQLCSVLDQAELETYIMSLIEPLIEEGKMQSDDALAHLSQRVAFDVMTAGASSGSVRVQAIVRQQMISQIGRNLRWLLSASAPAPKLETLYISLPLVSKSASAKSIPRDTFLLRIGELAQVVLHGQRG